MEAQEVQKMHELARRTAIQRLQDTILGGGLDVGKESCPVKHHFAPGMYSREMFLPAGLVVVGKIHRYSHVNIISKGKVRVFTEQEGLRELEAPCTFISSPMTKRVVVVLEDTVWNTVHATDETDPDVIEAEIIVPEVV